jgi:D-3-phosphoglycerate dehydrogenase
MSGKRLVLADSLAEEGLKILRAASGLVVEDCSARSRDELKESLAGAAGLIVRSATRADADLLDSADSLEVIGRAGVGLDNIDVETATRRGIAVLNAPAGNAISTAELSLALLLAAARRIPAADRSVREGRWEREAFRGAQLSGKTLGVLGAGRIGSEVILRARAFGMRVLVADPFLTAERATDLGAELLSLDELLPRADFLTIHVPLTDETRGLLGADELTRMQPSAILINAARGGVVDEDALADALHAGRLAGAALDVFSVEPFPADHPLRSAPGVVLTPHLGAATPEAQREVAVEIARSVRDALLEGDFRTAVNLPGVGLVDRARVDPVLDLARRLGAVLSELTDGRCRRIALRFGGGLERVLRLIAASAVEGYLSRSLAGPLNLINSLVLAADRGIEVTRARIGVVTGYAGIIELSASDGEDELVVVGVLENDRHPRLLRIGSFHVDVEPRGNLLLVSNRDVPGVIGQVGTLVGATGVNIAEFHQARNPETGEALAVLALDDPLPAGVVAELRELEAVREVRQVSLDA